MKSRGALPTAAAAVVAAFAMRVESGWEEGWEAEWEGGVLISDPVDLDDELLSSEKSNSPAAPTPAEEDDETDEAATLRAGARWLASALTSFP